MAQRRKCTTEFVQNDKARLATFKRRSHCLLKKASELATLCDVDVAVLIYAYHLSDRPLVYPPESGESLRIIKKLKENPRCVPAANLKPDKFLNQANHCKGPIDKFCDDITSLNVDELNSLLRVLDAKETEVLKKIEAIEQSKIEAAVDEVSDPNGFLFSGNDNRSKLFDHQPHGFQGQISYSVLGNEDSGKQLIENNFGFLNQIYGHVNYNNNDEITSFNVGEAGVDQVCDRNYFIFSGDDRQSALFDNQQDGFQWPFSFSVMGEDNTSKSKSEHFTEENSSLLNPISGHSNSIHYDELMSVDIGELDLAKIFYEMEEDGIDTIGEKSNGMANCWNFPESFSNEFSDPKCFLLNGGGWPNPRVSESTKVFDFQTGSSSAAMAIPCSEKTEDDTPISEPHYLIDNNSRLLGSVAPISIAEGEEAQSESNMVNEKKIETSFTESIDFGSLAAIFSDEIPDVNGLFFNSENPMYHPYESLDYQPFGCRRPIPFS